MIYTLYKPKIRGYALVYDKLAEGSQQYCQYSTRTRSVIHLDLVGFYLVGRRIATAAAAGLLHTPSPGVAALLVAQLPEWDALCHVVSSAA